MGSSRKGNQPGLILARASAVALGAVLAGARSRVAVLSMLSAIATAPAHGAECRPDEVTLRWDGGQARFSVEVADDEAERSQGLMFREKLAASAGMLFVYPRPQHARFWMANTLIPLDMIFADAAGRVTRVHAMAQPQDRSTVDGGEGVQYVLEINGGLARRLGIREGAEMRHPSIADGAWPCTAE